VVSDRRRFRLLGVLGKGGFGTVYKAELLGAGGFSKAVALKFLNDNPDAPAEVALRLRDEARILGLIRHRAVVGVDGLVRFDDGWGVVMEYIEGVDLKQVVESEEVPPRAALSIAEEVASALNTAYNQPAGAGGAPLKLVHRDIKPANIRLTSHREVKVLDFGTARAEFEQREALTRSVRYGTMNYMAPERLGEEDDDGPEGDLYSLGLVLAELLGGPLVRMPPKTPRKFTSFVDELLDGIAQVLTEVWSFPESQTTALLQLLDRAIAFEPEERWSLDDFEQLCGALQAEVGGPRLRDWAGRSVPGLMAEGAPLGSDDFTGTLITERGDALAAAADLPPPERAVAPALRAKEPSTSETWSIELDPVAPAAVCERAAVEAAPAIDSAPAPSSAPVAVPRPPQTGRWKVPAALGALVLIGGVLGVVVLPDSRPAEEAEPVVSAPPSTEHGAEVAPSAAVDEAVAGSDEQTAAQDEVADTRAPAASLSPTRGSSTAQPDPAASSAAPPSRPVTVAPTPAPAPVVTTGTFSLHADNTAEAVVFRNAEGRFGPGEPMPTGTYDVYATMNGQTLHLDETVGVGDGSKHVVKCIAAFTQCDVQ